jgi:DNA-binding LacI/PurR family transcriptional regulator
MAKRAGNNSLPTVTEVAKFAGVSRALVYAVLNAEKKTNIGVSADKSKLVKKVAAELGYVRNEAARALVSGKTHSIGVVVGSLKNSFFADFFSCLDDACYSDGYSMLIGISENNKEREARSLRTMLAKRVDAIVLGRTHPGYNDDVLNAFLQQNIPIVILGEGDTPNTDYFDVAFDEPVIGELVAEYLWGMGHRKVAYFRPVIEGDLTYRMHDMRRNDFCASWAALTGGDVRQFSTADITHGGDDLAYNLAKLPITERPTGVVCSCDTLAITAIHALRARGISVPDDISVIGCDDIGIASDILVPLTTICLPRNELAQGVWQLLYKELVSSEETPAGGNLNRQLLIKPKLIVRKSTAKVRRT